MARRAVAAVRRLCMPLMMPLKEAAVQRARAAQIIQVVALLVVLAQQEQQVILELRQLHSLTILLGAVAGMVVRRVLGEPAELLGVPGGARLIMSAVV